MGTGRRMNIYLISQTVNKGYDTFDCAVVAAKNEDDARYTHPAYIGAWDGTARELDTWCNAKDVIVEKIGAATKEYENKTVLCASYNGS